MKAVRVALVLLIVGTHDAAEDARRKRGCWPARGELWLARQLLHERVGDSSLLVNGLVGAVSVSCSRRSS